MTWSFGGTGVLARGVAVGLALWAGAGGALAKDGPVPVDVELVFAVDISYSMDTVEQQLQRAGYVQALQSPQFLQALKSGPTGRIAVAYMQWASQTDQDVLLPWTVIDSPDSAKAVADRLGEAPYRRAQRTSVSGAIDKGVSMFDGNGFSSDRMVIDVSGDGPNNSGRAVVAARDEAVAKGITINGLPLVGIRQYMGPADLKNLDDYYEDCVIGGSDAFMIVIHSTKDFVDATRNKLIREIAWAPHPQPLSPLVQFAADHPPRVSCAVGENMWRGQWGN